MDDERKNNPGEPNLEEEEFGDTELDRDDTHGTPDLAEDVEDAGDSAERPEGHS